MVERKLICGVGVNDSDYAVRVSINGIRKYCPFFQTWRSMIYRCYNEKIQEKQPSYAVCLVTPEWLSFMSFREWMSSQNWRGKEIDKDILIKGNKIYSPETCIFVDKAINLFIIDRGADRGEFPIGVCWHTRDKKYQAQCSNPFTGKGESLGYFNNPEDAHLAWLRRKNELANLIADTQTDPRLIKALRSRYSAISDVQSKTTELSPC